jgi:hypothetical protein
MNEHNPRTDTPFASIVHLRWEKNFHFLFVRHYPGRGELENGSFHSYGSEISHGTCIGNSKKSRMELALEIQRNRSTHFLRDSSLKYPLLQPDSI